MNRTKTATYIILGVCLILAAYLYIHSIPPPNGKYDALATCIKESGTIFYGAFWCPHCHNQKNEFGDSAQYLPYTECSLPDESGQTQVCIQNNIKTYPTWVFPDGSRLTGEVSLATLAQKTGCALPEEPTSTVVSIPSSPTDASLPQNSSTAKTVSKDPVGVPFY